MSTATNSELVYTTTCKLHNVNFDSSRIELTPDAWIETNPQFRGEPRGLSYPQLAFFETDWRFGLGTFSKGLLASEVELGARYTESQGETNPFAVDNCSHIALAISCLTEYFFVAGLETFANSKNINPPSMSPYVSLFWGISGQARIAASQESELKEVYDFIRQAWGTSDRKKMKLLSLYSGCVIKPPQQPVTALKVAYPPVIHENNQTMVYAHLFFEHVFTRESGRMDKVDQGVTLWNNIFGLSPVNPDDIKIVYDYRHLAVHDNPTGAKSRIAQWEANVGLSDIAAIREIEKRARHTVRCIMKAIAGDYRKYEMYRQQLPI